MIATEIYSGQGLGNQLWCYVTTRVIAADRGYDFGIIHPERFKCRDFLNLDYGKEITGITHHYTEKSLYYLDTDVRTYDADLVHVADNTKIDGVMQDEQYILHRKDEIRDWLRLPKKYECNEYASDDICIINFRGGEYVTRKDLFLTKKYWKNAMQNMRSISKDFRFIVITDDIIAAKKFFPTLEVFHFNVAKDYAILSAAHYLILSNSSFAWFPAWLNENLKMCIAPKYWARHNVSDGYWSCGYNITTGWMYQDRDGNLQDYATCIAELAKYNKNHMRTLDEIALDYGTDKSSLAHNYTKLYSMYFEDMRLEKLKILEIGIDKGYSLKSWKEYFPNASITGIDIVDLKHFEEDRVHVEQGDQKDTALLKKVNDTYGPFDIIIDDGSHHNADMKASFDYLFPLLNPDGIYVVEDLHACYWPGTGEPVFLERIKKLVDQVNSAGKSGVANIWRDKEDKLYIKKKMGEMDWWEKHVEFLNLYRSIVFIKKYPEEPLVYTVGRNYRKIKNKVSNPRAFAGKIKKSIQNLMRPLSS